MKWSIEHKNQTIWFYLVICQSLTKSFEMTKKSHQFSQKRLKTKYDKLSKLY